MAENRKLRVFLCHASQDKPAVRALYRRLNTEGWIDPWLDEEKILPGQDWRYTIEEAVESSDVIIFFISHNSVSKEGFVQKEIRYSLDIAQEKPEGTIFIIPVRLDDEIFPPKQLRSYQWVDYSDKNSYQNILMALETRRKSINLLETTAAQYDLDVVNDLLRELSEKQLRTLVYEELPLLFDRLNWNAYSFKTASDIILYAQKEDKVSNLVNWISKNSLRLYSKYSSKLELKGSIKSDDNFIIGNKNKINLKRIDKNKFRNPYVAGNPIQPTNSRVFWGRLDIADAIVYEIKRSRQKPSFLLYGRRRMGKTSTLLNLRRLIRDIKIIDVLISGQNSKFHTDTDFCFHIIDKIIKSTKDSSLLAGNNSYSSKHSDKILSGSKPSLVLSIFFEDYHEFLEKNDLYCLLMLDEYEEFGGLSRELLLQLRDTMQHLPRIIFMFSGVSHINELPNPFWSEVFINVRNLKISFLDRSDGYKLLTEPAPELLYDSPRLIDRILDLTGGQPFLLQAIATEMVNNLNLSNKMTITNEDLDFGIQNVFKTWENYFQDYIWTKECFTDTHKQIISKVAAAKKVKLSSLNFSKQVDDLIRKDLLRMQDGYLTLTMPIIGLWLDQGKPSRNWLADFFTKKY